MNKKTELIIVKSLVKEILTEDTRARNSDSYLYLKVLDVFSVKKHIDVNNIPVKDFLLNMSAWGFPPFETVRRSRQQLQHELSELSASEEVQEARAENEAVFKDFSRGRA